MNPKLLARAQRSTTPSSVQLSLDLGEERAGESARLPEMSDSDRVRAELELLGLDASRHIIDFHQPLLDALGVVRSRDLLAQRSRAEILVAGVKVATQTPPIRSGRRVIFLTLDDATGPVDATFFEDVQGPYARTVFGSWLGGVREDGRRGRYKPVDDHPDGHRNKSLEHHAAHPRTSAVLNRVRSIMLLTPPGIELNVAQREYSSSSRDSIPNNFRRTSYFDHRVYNTGRRVYCHRCPAHREF